MPLVLPPTIGQGVHETNLTAASRLGTTVTASGTAHVKGSYASLIDPTDFPSYGLWLRARNVAVGATLTNILLDVAYGPTGGGNEQIVIPNLTVGAAGTATDGPAGKLFFFPVYIPTGVRVSARCQAATVSDTVSVAIALAQNTLYPWAAGLVEDYGTITASSSGTVVTAGSGAFGSWVELLQNDGSTSGTKRNHRFWAIGVDQGSDTSFSGEGLVEIGTGPSTADVTRLFEAAFAMESTEIVSGCFPLLCHAPLPSGAKVFARTAAGGAETLGVIAYGMD